MSADDTNAARRGSESNGLLGLEPERAAFEAAAEAHGLPLAREPEWHPLGQPESARPYYAARTNAAWWAWQASQAAERERCAKLVETQDPNGDYGVRAWFDLLAAKIRA